MWKPSAGQDCVQGDLLELWKRLLKRKFFKKIFSLKIAVGLVLEISFQDELNIDPP